MSDQRDISQLSPQQIKARITALHQELPSTEAEEAVCQDWDILESMAADARRHIQRLQEELTNRNLQSQFPQP